jgi:hypothetical protein
VGREFENQAGNETDYKTNPRLVDIMNLLLAYSPLWKVDVEQGK